MADNQTPVAQDDTFRTDEDTLLTGTAGVLLNDSDANIADILTVTALNGSILDIGSQVALPSGALLTLNADGTFVYDPNGQFDFLDSGGMLTLTDSFSYTVSDGNGGLESDSKVSA